MENQETDYEIELDICLRKRFYVKARSSQEAQEKSIDQYQDFCSKLNGGGCPGRVDLVNVKRDSRPTKVLMINKSSSDRVADYLRQSKKMMAYQERGWRIVGVDLYAAKEWHQMRTHRAWQFFEMFPSIDLAFFFDTDLGANTYRYGVNSLSQDVFYVETRAADKEAGMYQVIRQFYAASTYIYVGGDLNFPEFLDADIAGVKFLKIQEWLSLVPETVEEFSSKGFAGFRSLVQQQIGA